MTKFLIILIIVIGLIIAGLYYVKRILNKFVSNAFSQFNTQTGNIKKQPKEQEVIYEKDEIIVLKGESNKKNKK